MQTIGLSSSLLLLAGLAPLALGAAAAWPFWTRQVRDDIGNIVGTGVVLACAIGFIAREFGDVLEITRRCVETETPCRFRPEPFTRYAIYGGIGLVQVFVIFVVGLGLEERRRRRAG